MGTDIHGVLQVRENGSWRSLAEGFSDRNYQAFALLGNVRNGFGFAGVKTGEPIEPLSDGRGLPGDFEGGEDHPVPPEFRWDRKWNVGETTQNMGDHSYSWVDGNDVERITLDATHRAFGVVPIAVFREIGGVNKRPPSWCGGISGPNVVVIDAEAVLDREEDLHPGKDLHVQTWWDEPLYDALGERFTAFIRQMQDLAKSHGRDNVRFVFGFDS